VLNVTPFQGPFSKPVESHILEYENFGWVNMSSDAHVIGHGTAVLEKALDVLDAVAREPHGVSQASLSKLLGLPRTTLYRLLAKLVERGMLRHDPKRRVFALGYKCFELARQAYAKPDLVLAASTELRMLRDLTGETSYLAILEEHESLSIERYDGVHDKRSQAALGQRKPLHCTSHGKAMLAALAPAKRDALIKTLDLKAITPASITDRRKLATELKLTSARGWSIDDEEVVPGVRCVGAAVLDSLGELRGAISVAGPAFRMTRERIEALGQEVAEAARRIGAQLSPDTGTSPQRDVQVLNSAWAFRGEFPVWCADEKLLFWADSLAPSIQVFDGVQNHLVAAIEAPIHGMVNFNDEILVACECGYSLWPAKIGAARQTGSPGFSPKLWPRHAPIALCVRGGQNSKSRQTLWACWSLDSERWQVAEYRLDNSSEPTAEDTKNQAIWVLQEALHALAWDPQGEVLYGLNRQSGNIIVMRPGQTHARRLATVPKGSGRLSGLAIDALGGIWTCLEEGWCAMRFLPDGRQDRVVGLPIPCPTGLVFGGKHGESLYVTSARHSVSLEALVNAPLSGRLFSVQTDPIQTVLHEVNQRS
jgi:IclR family transcriptional regulator, acetate operon repressor